MDKIVEAAQKLKLHFRLHGRVQALELWRDNQRTQFVFMGGMPGYYIDDIFVLWRNGQREVDDTFYTCEDIIAYLETL